MCFGIRLEMVSGAKIEGGTQILSAGVRKTIQSIKEIVGNHSDAEIYVTLKETNMDPNETAQKLLNQDPFHEVKRKRDKKKEVTGYKGSAGIEPRKQMGLVGQGVRSNINTDNNVRRGGYSRNALSGVSREFRVVRDNRVDHNVSREIKPPSLQGSLPTNEPVTSAVSEKSSTGPSNNQKPPAGRHSVISGMTHGHPRQAREASSRVQGIKPNDSQPHSSTSVSNSVVGLYSSSSDPVHVPSLDSRPAANVGAIKREVGVVGVRRQSSENPVKLSSAQTSSFTNSHSGRDRPSSRESFRSFTGSSKTDRPSQSQSQSQPESTILSIPASRSFVNNQHSSRSHQLVGHQKAPQPNKEWKPKSSQKPSDIGHGVIGTPAKSVSSPGDSTKDLQTEATKLQDKLSRVNISENQNVIIAAHIRVSEADRCGLTFGSLGTDFEPSWNSQFHAVEVDESCIEPSPSISPSAPESLSDETSASKQADSMDERFQNSGSNSPASGVEASELQLTDIKESSSSPRNLDSYADIGMVHDNSPSYTPPESQQQQDPPELPSFSAYDPQTGYDIPYFRPAVDETVRGQGLSFPQEALSSHMVNSIPASTIAMLQQQQQPPVAQMYPQVHVSHFANLMPYRQFLSPVYVPPMAMPGYSSNPAAYPPHPSNANSYLLMPGGGSSHLAPSGIKYGIQQFKPVPTGSPTGFGNFTSPTGYAINAPGVVGSATGIEDSSRLKYKDGNLYVPNPQGETSEIWMNPRDIPGMQSASYYNMQGQAPPHAATYLPSHTGHSSFNVAPQSSHMQFPTGLFHPPPQGAAIANPHHLGPAMGGNVGVGVAAAAPGAQLSAYQQPQLGHLNWTGNF